MLSHSHKIRLSVCTASAMLLSSCVVKDGSLDFTWWKDAAAPAMEDDVVVESGYGHHYRSTPAPIEVPKVSLPEDNPAASESSQSIVSQNQPATTPPPAKPKQKTSLKEKTQKLVAAQPQPKVAPPAGSPSTHVVQRGDTLTRIARRYKTTVNALVAANKMESAETPLRIGQTLVIPQKKSTKATQARRPAAAPRPATTAAPRPTAAPGTYTVQRGDTLFGIARRYGVSATALMQANGLTPETANTIRVGAILRIPSAP